MVDKLPAYALMSTVLTLLKACLALGAVLSASNVSSWVTNAEIVMANYYQHRTVETVIAPVTYT